jgi:hypothetical protein
MEFIRDAHYSTLGGAANSNSTLGAGVFDDDGTANASGLARPAHGIN